MTAKQPGRRHYSTINRRGFKPKTHGEAREIEYQQRRAEVPKDTRTEAQILMGEPVPGRRAIDQRGRA